jgi:hypothetical protein
MTTRIAAAAPMPLWINLGSVARQAIRALSVSAADVAALEELDAAQTRIRQSSRLWLVG